MESIITGGIFFGLFTGLVAFIWRDTIKRVDRKIEAAMPRELCGERHKALDEKLDEMKGDIKEVLRVLAKLNGDDNAKDRD
jgi:hypothetical protein